MILSIYIISGAITFACAPLVGLPRWLAFIPVVNSLLAAFFLLRFLWEAWTIV